MSERIKLSDFQQRVLLTLRRCGHASPMRLSWLLYGHNNGAGTVRRHIPTLRDLGLVRCRHKPVTDQWELTPTGTEFAEALFIAGPRKRQER